MSREDLQTTERQFREIVSENRPNIAELKQNFQTNAEGWVAIMMVHKLERDLLVLPSGLRKTASTSMLQSVVASAGMNEKQWRWIANVIDLERLMDECELVAEEITRYLAGPQSAEGLFSQWQATELKSRQFKESMQVVKAAVNAQ